MGRTGSRRKLVNLKYRRIDNKKFIIILYVVIAAALLLVGVMLYWWYSQKLVGYTPGEATYQIYSKIEFDYDKDATFYLDDYNSIVTKVDGTSKSCPSVPLIFVSGGKLATVADMSLTTGEDSKVQGRVLAFSELEEAGGIVVISKNGGKAQAMHGYLYDGNDTYIFLERTTVTMGNDSYTLGPLSYAICQYNEQVDMYNSDTQENIVVGLINTDVKARGETFSLDLGQDLKYDEDDNKAMLFSSIGSLDAIKMTN